MQALMAKGGLSPDASGAFFLAEVPDPVPGRWDLLVRVAAVSVNPVDTKVHARLASGGERILGYDAVGTVAAVGEAVTGFAPGDRVYYAGDATRPGTDATLHLVDARIAAKAPQTLDDAAAAAMPLTSLTAYEALFDRLGLTDAARTNAGREVLVLGGAGGVGSMAIQLAVWAGARVIATASRSESAAWCRELGAHLVLDHSKDMPAALRSAGITDVGAIFCTTHMEAHWRAMAAMIAPQGALCLIDDPSGPLDITVFKSKCASIRWEFMFARSMYKTPDMARQGAILARVAALLDSGVVRPTLGKTRHGLDPAVFAEAHLAQRSGRMVGKQVVVF
ncbi:zinc-binding alcohol dehydrogenase family protein [Solidesulfovibrio fructosivorans JJ]]|uniref:Zinc-type alcohol dehydrogenase-like protein n=1 Tax=Solidesulfovibrio fructosivorans JJ] TaxID=596151 RepID=E1K037_SOLFR|nr:zinc-binding alcohol dehydrogenase family protein [Solidesulfovibrio fructosivorans]EFL50043.1 zinc-binding alcohol dehydrogenase family protein [Solidesulfovibrio fructosivorans JJ]]